MSAKALRGEDLEVVLAEKRYETIGKIVKASVRKREAKLTFSDMLDKVFLHKYLGIPIFLAIMWAVFQFTFEVSSPFMDMLESGFGLLGKLAGDATTPLASLWADGICAGLGFIMIFIFPIFFLFVALAILELSGYLPRAAFVMDRAMYKIGLPGKAFVPMLMGFGCNLPAIMATRGIEDEKDRLTTILVNPLMSCGARLPVYVVIAGALFPDYAGTVVFSMYILGITLAVLMALLFRKVIPALKGKPGPLILELPPYLTPTPASVGMLTWERGVVFVKKAGTILFAGAVLMWFLTYFPWGVEPGSAESYAGKLGQAVQPIFSPLGFSSALVIALIFGFLAKEIIVETLGILYGAEEEAAIKSAIAANVSPVTGFAFMAFVLTYLPCLATVGIVKAETGSWKWVGFLILYELLLAYAVAAVIVGIGSLL